MLTFKCMILKNLKYNIKYHFALLMCCILNCSVINLYCNLLFNDNKLNQNLMLIASSFFIILIIFSVIFINTVFISYIKSRSQELALYLSLGMCRRNINQLLNFENIIIGVTSIFIGITLGTAIGGLLNYLISNTKYLKVLNFSFTMQGFLITILTMLIIFICIICYSNHYIKKHHIIELFKEQDKNETSINTDTFKIVIPFIFILSSYIIMFINRITYDKRLISILAIVLFFISSYVIISRFGSFLFEKTKKNLNKYYDKLIYLMDIKYKFKHLKKVLFLIALGNGAVIFIMATFIALIPVEIENVEINNPYDFVVYSSSQNLSYDSLNSIVNKTGTEITNYNDCEFLVNFHYGEPTDDLILKNGDRIFLDKEANRVFGTEFNVKKNQAIFYGRIIKGYNKYNLGGKQFAIQQNVFGELVNDARFSFLVNSTDYKFLRKQLSTYNVKHFSIKDIEKSEQVYLAINNFIHDELNIGKSLKGIVFSKEHDINQQYSYMYPMVFLFGIIGLLFFICSGAILYFQVFVNINKDRIKFNKLWAIGITKREFKYEIKKELSIVFNIPIIFGGFGAYLWIITIFSVNYNIVKIALYSGIVVILYLFIQLIFYNLTKVKYIKRLFKSKINNN